jgi:D-galactarolactone isomerase
LLASTYSTDGTHYLGLAPLPQFGGKDRARMVGMVNPSVTDQDLRRMQKAGVRGIRFNLSPLAPPRSI